MTVTRSTSKRKELENEIIVSDYYKQMKQFEEDIDFGDDYYPAANGCVWSQQLFGSSLSSDDSLLYLPQSKSPVTTSPSLSSLSPFAQTEYIDDNVHNPNLAVAFDASKTLTEAVSKDIKSLVHSMHNFHNSTKNLDHLDFARRIDHDICSKDPIIYNVNIGSEISKEPTSFCRIESSKAHNYKNEQRYYRYMFTFGLDIAVTNGEELYRCHEYPKNSFIIVKHPDEVEDSTAKDKEIDIGGFYDNYAFNTILSNHRINL